MSAFTFDTVTFNNQLLGAGPNCTNSIIRDRLQTEEIQKAMAEFLKLTSRNTNVSILELMRLLVKFKESEILSTLIQTPDDENAHHIFKSLTTNLPYAESFLQLLKSVVTLRFEIANGHQWSKQKIISTLIPQNTIPKLFLTNKTIDDMTQRITDTLMSKQPDTILTLTQRSNSGLSTNNPYFGTKLVNHNPTKQQYEFLHGGYKLELNNSDMEALMRACADYHHVIMFGNRSNKISAMPYLKVIIENEHSKNTMQNMTNFDYAKTDNDAELSEDSD